MGGLLVGGLLGAVMAVLSMVALPQALYPAVQAATTVQPAPSAGQPGASPNAAGTATPETPKPLLCPSPRQSVAELDQAAGAPSLALAPGSPITPSGQPISVSVPETLDPKSKFSAAVTITQRFSSPVTLDLPVLAVRPAIGQAAPTTIIDLQAIPDDKLNFLGFPRFTLQVVACPTGDATKPARWGQTTGAVSDHLFATLAALVITALLYVAGARAKAGGTGFARYSPIRLATDGSGRASLAQMQIIYFSVIVLFMVTYILLRTGVLANLSTDVLLLLGIAGLGSVGATVVTTSRQRVSFDNWAWAQRKGWFAPSGYHVPNPRWADLITSDGDFDPYRFQMLSFSLVVGMALLLTGVNGLAAFAIPPALQGVLGLSQVVYIGGKMFSQATFGELDAKLTALRQAEQDFITATAAAWIPPPAPPGTPAAAIAADQAGYLKFLTLVGPTWKMFQELIPMQGHAPRFEPSL